MSDKADTLSQLIDLIQALPPGRRPFVIAACLTNCPVGRIAEEFDLGTIRVALVHEWEVFTGRPMPVSECRIILGNPLQVASWNILGRFIVARTDSEIARTLVDLFEFLGYGSE